MLNLEQTFSSGGKFSFSTLAHVPSLPLICNTMTGSRVHESHCSPQWAPLFRTLEADYENAGFQNSFSARGGVFADEGGLGKKISMISLILSHPRKANESGEFTRSTMRAGRFPTFVSKATLIICAKHFAEEWQDQIRRYTSLSCQTVTSETQLSELTYQMLVESDVVIITSFMVDRIEDSFYEREELQPPSIGSELHLHDCFPILQEIDWHRIILDQETIGFLDSFDIESSFRWLVSGSVDLYYQCNLIRDLKTFLDLKVNRVHSKRIPVSKIILLQAIRKFLFRRNAKKQVQEDVLIPPASKVVIRVVLSPIERAIYDVEIVEETPFLRHVVRDPHLVYEYVSALSDPQFPCKLLERLHNALSSRVLEQQDQHFPSARTIRCSIQDKKEFKSATLFWRNRTLTILFQISAFTKLIMGDRGDETCGKCYQFASGGLVLSCDHRICFECLREVVFRSNEEEGTVCLCCGVRADLSKCTTIPSVVTFDMETAKTYFRAGINDDPGNVRLRRSFGSKLLSTGRFLEETMKTQPKAKVVVFSRDWRRFDRLRTLLHVMDPVMFESDVGTLTRRDKLNSGQEDSLRRNVFEGSQRVLFLSNNVTGLYLAETTHFLLLDAASCK